jgi:hypothetical protein
LTKWSVSFKINELFVFGQKIEGFSYLSRILEQLTGDQDDNVALNASICIGKLGIIDSVGAQQTLKKVADENLDWTKKSLALEVLVRHFNERSRETMVTILNHVQNSPVWSSRVSAVKLLAILGKLAHSQARAEPEEFQFSVCLRPTSSHGCV